MKEIGLDLKAFKDLKELEWSSCLYISLNGLVVGRIILTILAYLLFFFCVDTEIFIPSNK